MIIVDTDWTTSLSHPWISVWTVMPKTYKRPASYLFHSLRILSHCLKIYVHVAPCNKQTIIISFNIFNPNFIVSALYAYFTSIPLVKDNVHLPLRNSFPAVPPPSLSCLCVGWHQRVSEWECYFHCLNVQSGLVIPRQQEMCRTAGVAADYDRSEITSAVLIIKPWLLTTYI